MPRGRFITLEGGEGAGKTTQLRRLCAGLTAEAGLEVMATREPGGSPLAEAIRPLILAAAHDWSPLTEALLHCAARCEHLRQTVRPALEAGRWVVSDRFFDSTVAYQVYGRGAPAEAVAEIDARVRDGLRPDLTIVLDVAPEVGLARRVAEGDANRYEDMDLDFHRRVRDGFLTLARREPERCLVLDGDRGVEAVQADIMDAVRSRLLRTP